MLKVSNKKHQNGVTDFELWTFFTPFSIISIVEFEQVNVSRVTSSYYKHSKYSHKLLELFYRKLLVKTKCLERCQIEP